MFFETFLVVALVAVADIAMGHFWFAPYYSIGLPLLYRVIRVSDRPSTPPTADCLRSAFQSLDRNVSIAPLGDGVFAFREDSGRETSPRYTQLLHGSLAFNAKEGTLTVTGLVNYFPVAFCAAIAAQAWAGDHLWTAALPAVVMGPIYLLQRSVYTDVAEAAARAWHATANVPAA